MFCASNARLIARLVCLTSSGSIAAMCRASVQRRLVQLGRRHDAVDHADLTGALRPDTRSSPVRMISLATFGPTIHGRIIDHDAGAEFQLRLAEERILRRNRDVAGERQLAGTGEAGPAHGGDGRASGNARTA